MQYDWIYTDLDSLLDTRLTTYGKLDPSFPKQVLRAGYRSRTYDRFDSIGIPWEKWRKMYLMRDKSFLEDAKLTYVASAIKVAIVDKEQQAMTAPLLQPQLMINIAPYVLDESEMIVIRNSMHSVLNTGEGFEIKIVDVPMLKLTPKWLHSENVFDMYTTNGEDWLQLQLSKEILTKDPCRDITMHLPALVTGITDNPNAVMKKQLPELIHMMSPFITLDYMIADVFSQMSDEDLDDSTSMTPDI